MFSTVKHVHFVGIGGIGMSGIAEILLSQGFTVSGSDMHIGEVTERLRSLGAIIYKGHSSTNIQGAEVVVYSSAVRNDDNPETEEARRLGIPVIRRAEMLAEVARLNYCLAIAGTHGKTTTTSMCGLMMMRAGFDPTVIVGGKLSGLGGTNARLGKGKWTVVEADEYDRSFLQLSPTIAVINNIEAEHLDIYGSEHEVQSAFVEFANRAPFYGVVVIGSDDRGVRTIFPQIAKKVVTFGLSRQADIHAIEISHEGRSSFCTVVENGEVLGAMTVNVPGVHNLKNALAAVAVGRQLGVDFAVVAESIMQFSGVYRRFEFKGEVNNILIVDDYAHHPTEVKAALQAARNGWKERRIVAVFQPHTYTRTRDFYQEFAQSFDDADIVIITDIYAARELPIEGVSGALIAETARRLGHKNVVYEPRNDHLEETVRSIVQPNDIFLTLGAGDVWKLADNFVGKTT